MAYGLTQSIDFELSSSQRAAAADSTSLSFTGDFTCEGWLKPESIPAAGRAYMLSKNDGATLRSYQVYFGFITSNVRLRCVFNSSAAVDSELRSDNAFVDAGDLGVWLHWAVAMDVSVPSGVMYKNGSSVAATMTSSSATSVADTDAVLTVAAGEDGAGGFEGYYDGRMSLMRIWNVQRSGSEIADNMCNVYGGATSNLVAEWSFDNVYTDASGNSNTLTPTNAPTFGSDVPAVCTVVASSNFRRRMMVGIGR